LDACVLRVFGRPFVKRFALCYRTVVCLSVCLSITLVYCGQTVGWIKMKLGMEIGLGPGHIVLDGDQVPQKWNSPQFSVIVFIVAKRSIISAILLSTCCYSVRLLFRYRPAIIVHPAKPDDHDRPYTCVQSRCSYVEPFLHLASCAL